MSRDETGWYVCHCSLPFSAQVLPFLFIELKGYGPSLYPCFGSSSRAFPVYSSPIRMAKIRNSDSIKAGKDAEVDHSHLPGALAKWYSYFGKHLSSFLVLFLFWPFLILVSYTYPIYQWILLNLHSKYTWNLIISHHLHCYKIVMCHKEYRNSVLNGILNSQPCPSIKKAAIGSL